MALRTEESGAQATDLKARATMDQWTSVEYSYFSGPAMRIVTQKMMVPMRGGQTDRKSVV